MFLVMQHITGISRHEMLISGLEEAISPDDQVRFIDAIVENINLAKLGFAVQTSKKKDVLNLSNYGVREVLKMKKPSKILIVFSW
jgi:hypothetical protein